MKKRHIRVLKMLEKRLPESWTIVLYTQHAFGHDFLKADEDMSHLPNFDPDLVYNKKIHKLQKINHMRKLKAAWKQDRKTGLQEYLKWLNRNNKYVNSKVSEHQKMQEMDKGLLRLLSLPVNRFWKGLLAFLFAFVNIFMSKEKESV